MTLSYNIASETVTFFFFMGLYKQRELRDQDASFRLQQTVLVCGTESSMTSFTSKPIQVHAFFPAGVGGWGVGVGGDIIPVLIGRF